jgi:hypothetical protein
MQILENFEKRKITMIIKAKRIIVIVHGRRAANFKRLNRIVRRGKNEEKKRDHLQLKSHICIRHHLKSKEKLHEFVGKSRAYKINHSNKAPLNFSTYEFAREIC